MSIFKILEKYFKINRILGDIQKNQFIFFQGRGPRDEIAHIGHLILYEKLNQCAKQTGSKYIFQISDDEKREYVPNSRTYALSKQLSALLQSYSHVDYLFINTDVYDKLEPVARYLSSLIKLKSLIKIFGQNVTTYNLNYFYMQIAPILYATNKYPDRQILCVVAQDQEPIFCLARDICKKLKITPPLICIIEPLKDIYLKGKMSSSSQKSGVFLHKFEKILKSISGNTESNDFCTHLLANLRPIISCAKFKTLSEHSESKLIQKKQIIQFLYEKFNFSKKITKKRESLFANYAQVFKQYHCYDSDTGSNRRSR